MKTMSLFLSLAYGGVLVSPLHALPSNSDDTVWLEVCGSGQLIPFDLADDDNDTPVPAHALKACHAVCCSREMSGSVKDKATD